MERIDGYDVPTNNCTFIKINVNDTIDAKHASGRKDMHCHRIFKITSPLDIPDIGIFNKSAENEKAALQQRHVKQHLIQSINDEYLNEFKNVMQEITISIKLGFDGNRWSDYKVLSKKNGMLYTRYKNACVNNKRGYDFLSKQATRLSSFIKNEKFTMEKLLKGKPRLIQHRSYEYLLRLSRYLMPIDKHITISDDLLFGQTIKSMIGKGRDMQSITNDLKNSWDEFVHPVAICLDITEYDASLINDLLRVEHDIYLNIYNNERELKRLLKAQLHNTGVTEFGVRYNVKGTRASGEYNTSLGGTLINVGLIKAFSNKFQVRTRIMVLGDDSVIICERQDKDRIIDNVVEYMKNFNIVVKVDKIACEFEEIEFLQCQPVEIDGVYRLIRKPERLISRSSIMLNDFSSCVDRYKMTIGLGELSLNRGVPILQQFSLLLIDSASGARPLAKAKVYKAEYEPTLEVKSISESTRESFFRAFGITPNVQREIEGAWGQAYSGESIKVIERYKDFHKR